MTKDKIESLRKNGMELRKRLNNIKEEPDREKLFQEISDYAGDVIRMIQNAEP